MSAAHKGSLFGRPGYCVLLHSLSAGVQLPQVSVITQKHAKIGSCPRAAPQETRNPAPSSFSHMAAGLFMQSRPLLCPRCGCSHGGRCAGGLLRPGLPYFFWLTGEPTVTHCFPSGSLERERRPPSRHHVFLLSAPRLLCLWYCRGGWGGLGGRPGVVVFK